MIQGDGILSVKGERHRIQLIDDGTVRVIRLVGKGMGCFKVIEYC